MSRNRVIVGIIAVLGGLVFILSVGLAWERGYWNGYNEGWGTGRADGLDTGWQGCIEENNLYERYYYEDSSY